MFDYAAYIFWAYFLVLVPMAIVVLILLFKGKEIKKNISAR
jgi:heme exporter protein D|tara:strand:+ start:644 stop:766 length:123 start_codon:yes stop_codon:yes gene_type:complete